MVATLTRTSFAQRNADADRLGRTVQPLQKLLRQLGEVIRRLNDAQYTQKPVGVVESSVGAHVRHCLDHVRALLASTHSQQISYDHRDRGTAVETSRCGALAAIDEMVAELSALRSDVIDRPLRMSVMMSSNDEPIIITTTFGRELAYTLMHTVHHNALVATMVRTLGGWLPDRFGYAPSTQKHLNQR
jgi:uncharacterized damage-inducible protein DinB